MSLKDELMNIDPARVGPAGESFKEKYSAMPSGLIRTEAGQWTERYPALMGIYEDLVEDAERVGFDEETVHKIGIYVVAALHILTEIAEVDDLPSVDE